MAYFAVNDRHVWWIPPSFLPSLLVLLHSVSSQHPSPFHLGGLFFNISTGIVAGAELVPFNGTSMGEGTLAKWVRLELHHDEAFCHCVLCVRRPRRVILKRVVIEDLSLYLARSPIPPKVALVPKLRPALSVYMKALYQHRG
ncbi:unnamed protein product [Hydatigera taeniaeformis]|uniref:SOCS box domain-containing protein n=1 Tax=Hydatigena taeniaeformis TaxID=6205 RepID=A0A0R3XC37_HYDTA|nr:unnamed protein product [Hydatigera taeniaeformis]